MQQKLRTNRNRRRDGVAVTEMAICLPLLVLLILGSIESCNMIFIRHSLSVASYEGVRTAIRKKGTAAEAEAAATALLAGRGITDAQVTVFPPDLTNVEPGEVIRVQVTAEADKNRVIAPWFFWGRLIESNATMAKE